MTNMKKILFGLGTVTTVVAPVAAVVACGSDDKDTEIVGGWTVKSAAELKNLFAKIAKSDNQWVNDFDGLFTTLGGTTATPLELEVYKANNSASHYSSDDYAILVKGNPSIGTTGTINTPATKALEADWGVKTTDLKLASFFAIIKDWKLSIHDVIATDYAGTTVGISTEVDTSFTNAI